MTVEKDTKALEIYEDVRQGKEQLSNNLIM